MEEHLINEYIYEIKKSKFIGLMFHVESKEEVKSILDELKKEHKKARHIPYAYKIGSIASKSDDKEPNNTAGMPIYTILEQKDLKDTLIVVVRYFGGTKLGAGGLFRAYMEAARGVTDEIQVEKVSN